MLRSHLAAAKANHNFATTPGRAVGIDCASWKKLAKVESPILSKLISLATANLRNNWC